MNRNPVRLAGVTAALALTAVGTPVANAQEAPADRAELELSDIVVTARKQEESLQDVPLSVTAVQGDVLERAGYDNLSDLDRVAPGLYFEAVDKAKPRIFIRGVGTNSYDPGSDQSVGIFVDGVYQSRAFAADSGLLDVERVEVLRGPQGTLYGRNTIGGAIAVTTRAPSETPRVVLNAEVGQSVIEGDSLHAIWGSASGPLVEDRIYGSLAASHRYRDGYRPVQNRSFAGGEEDNWALHGALDFRLGSESTLRLTASHYEGADPPHVFSVDTLGGTAPVPGAAAPGVIIPPFSTDPYSPESELFDGHLDQEMSGVTAQLTVPFAGGELTSLTAYQEVSTDEVYDGDGSLLRLLRSDVLEDSNYFSQELRGTWTLGPVDVLLGAYYGRQNSDRIDSISSLEDSLIAFFGGGNTVWDFSSDLEANSYAVFGQLKYQATERLSLTFGGRYSRDEKDMLLEANSTPAVIVAPYTAPLTGEWESFDPMVSVSYEINPDVTTYATWSTGYKSGAFQYIALNSLVANVPVEPEDVQSFEIGMHSLLFDRRLRLNASAFHMEYEDLQLNRLTDTGAGIALVALTNAAQSTIDGVELEGELLLTSDWSVGFFYAYLDAQYDDFLFAPGQDFSGNRMVNAPENAANIALNYSHEYNGAQVDWRLAYNWRDTIYFGADNNEIDPNSSEGPLGLLDSSLAVGLDNWTLTLWGTNLTDERYRAFVANSTGVAQRTFWAAPRTVGLRVSYAFE